MAVINGLKKAAFITAVFCCLFNSPSTLAMDESNELDKLRLAFMFQLTKYIIWPSSSFSSSDTSIKLCLVGPNAVNLIDTQRQSPKLKNRVHGRKLELLAYPSWQDLQSLAEHEFCHLIYTDYIDEPPAEFVSLTRQNEAILIGKSVAFLDAGGSMALAQNGGKLAILLKEAWLNSSAVKLQSRLLRIIKMR